VSFLQKALDPVSQPFSLSIKILAENGIATLNELRSQNPLRIDAVSHSSIVACPVAKTAQLLQRKIGFGHEIVASASAMPRYDLRVEETGIYESKGNGVEVEISITCGWANTGQEGFKRKDKNLSRKVIDMTSVLTISSDYELIDFRRIK
jgi:ATP-dependent DNA helicase HFM1/MER3